MLKQIPLFIQIKSKIKAQLWHFRFQPGLDGSHINLTKRNKIVYSKKRAQSLSNQTWRSNQRKMAHGLVISGADPIRSFLVAASGDRDHLSDELRGLAASLSTLSSVPYKSLRSIWCALPAPSRPSLRLLLDGSDFVFTSPKPREKV